MKSTRSGVISHALKAPLHGFCLEELEKIRRSVGFIHVRDCALLSAVSVLDYVLMTSEQVVWWQPELFEKAFDRAVMTFESAIGKDMLDFQPHIGQMARYQQRTVTFQRFFFGAQ